MSVHITLGVDEAGYGPILGPLCIGAAYTTIRDIAPLADSKKVYQNKKIEKLIQKGFELFGKNHFRDLVSNPLNLHHEEGPWCSSNFEATDHFNFDEGQGTSIRPIFSGMCLEMQVGFFNRELSDPNMNKADVEAKHLCILLKACFTKIQTEMLEKKEDFELSLFIDRLGGRKDYRPLLESWGAVVLQEKLEDQSSQYQIRWFEKQIQITFLVKGDEKVPAIAAASYCAKTLREVQMRKFNDWWIEKCSGLKATAGYYTDGKRFLKEIEMYRKNYKIPDRILIRDK